MTIIGVTLTKPSTGEVHRMLARLCRMQHLDSFMSAQCWGNKHFGWHSMLNKHLSESQRLRLQLITLFNSDTIPEQLVSSVVEVTVSDKAFKGNCVCVNET